MRFIHSERKKEIIWHSFDSAYRRPATKGQCPGMEGQRSNQEVKGNFEGTSEIQSSDGRSSSQNNHNPDTPQI